MRRWLEDLQSVLYGASLVLGACVVITGAVALGILIAIAIADSTGLR